MTYLKFNWAPNEKLFEIGGFGIHIYSLMFIVAFLLGLRLYKRMFIKENVDQKYLEPMFIYMVISTLLGARLGEVFFYNWDYFQNHLLEILLPIKEKADGGYSFIGFRGLASHGAAIGVLTGIFIFQKLNPFKPLIWILDRLTIPAAIGGVLSAPETFLTQKLLVNTPVLILELFSKIEGKYFQDTLLKCMRHLAILFFFLYSRKSTIVDIEIKGDSSWVFISQELLLSVFLLSM